MSWVGRAFVAPPPGAFVGSYRLETELGRGAAGIVYRARHATTGALAALKVVSTDSLELAERFAREVEALGKLRHPNVVGIHAAGTGDGYGWFAMDLVEGNPLDRILARHEMTPGDLIAVIAQVARGVAHAHERGIAHRDLKPQNVIVTPERVARVTDFGLAKHLGRQTRLTKTGDFMGTPFYMSPEQASGNAARVDQRSDVWAIGVLLYEATTGTQPFQGDSLVAVCRAIIELDPERPRRLAPGVAPDLEAIILRALEKAPGKRYQTMAELASDLEGHIRGEPISASRSAPRFAGLRSLGQKRLLAGLVGVGLALTLALWLVARVRESSLDQESTLRVRGVATRIEADGRAVADRLSAGGVSSLEIAVVASRELGRLTRATEELMATKPRGVARAEVAVQAARLAVSPTRAHLATLGARALARLGETTAARSLLEATSRAGVNDAALETARGELALADDDFAGALEAFARALTLDPRAGDALLGSVRARARQTRSTEISTLEREVDQVENEHLAAPGPVTLARATVLAASGRDAQALLLLKEPTGAIAPTLLVLKAQVLRDQGNESAARSCLVAAALLDPIAGRAGAREDHELHAYADEAKLLALVLKLEPDDVRSLVRLAELRGSLGDLDAALFDLRRGIAFMERTEAGRARAAIAAAAILPLERAAHGEPRADPAVRAGDALAPAPATRPTDPATALALARSTPRPGRIPILEAALELPGSLEDRARVAAELAAEESLAGHEDDASRLVKRALALDARCERALDLEAAILARSGDLEAAKLRREQATAARPAATLLAFGEGRADALSITDGDEWTERPMAWDSPGTRRLAARAIAELTYASELSPGFGAPRGLLARLTLALGDRTGARAFARAALDADPFDVPGAIVLLTTADAVFAGDDVRATAAALATARWPESLELASIRARRALGSRDKDTANEIATGLLRNHPDDRPALKLVDEILKATHDPRRADVLKTLERRDADYAHVVALVRESERLAGNDDRPGALRKALEALALAPDEDVTIEAAEKAERSIHRVDAGQARVEGDNAPFDPLARCVLKRNTLPGDAIRHASALAEDLGPETLTIARQRLEATRDPREKLLRRTSLGLLLGGAAINRLDSRGRLVTGIPPSAPREGIETVGEILGEAPEVVVAYAVRALQLSRAGRRESAARDLDRILLRRPPTMSEHQVAAMALVLGDDLEAAAREAILGIALARRDDDVSRAFLAEPPFSSIAEKDAWRVVRAKLSR